MTYENVAPTDKRKRGNRRGQPTQQPPQQPSTDAPRRIPVIDKARAERDENSPTYVRVHDTLTTRDEYGEPIRTETVLDIDFRMTPKKYVPDLTINANYAEFLKWLFKDQVKKEKRWGRDDLRRRGLVRKAQVEDRGKIVTLYVPADQAHRDVEDLLDEYRERFRS